MHMPLRRRPSIDFAIGGVHLAQTPNAIKEMLRNTDDDLLVIGYGYYDASTLDSLGIGQWLQARPNRHVMLILGVQGKWPLFRILNPWSAAVSAFRQLLNKWGARGVPLTQIHVYGVAHWHVKIAATLKRDLSFPRPNFSGTPSTDEERSRTFDLTNFVTGYVTEAVIGSTNATAHAMQKERNFELDVHLLREAQQPPGHLPLDSQHELGSLNSKLHSLLRAMTLEVNNAATVSASATKRLRAELSRRLPRPRSSLAAPYGQKP